MPRERIQHGRLFIWNRKEDGDDPVEPGMTPGASQSEFHPGMVIRDDQLLREEPSFDVSWRREEVGGWVQLAFDAPRDWWERFFASYDGSPEQHHFAAYTNVLSRSEINHMIRILRRARDAAYGSDE